MKIKLLPAIAILFFLGGCSKSKNNPTPVTNDVIKINLVSGLNQTGQIGYMLSDSIVVKVTDNGNPVSGYDVQFIGSGCNSDLATDVNTKADGTAVYHWALAANAGAQTLKAVAVSQGKRIDSVAINATAVGSSGMPAKSACTPGGFPENIVSLSTGRLLACFYTQTSIRYSDDNGISWNPLKGFGANHTVLLLVTTPQDEIFAATDGDGVFYSSDGGSSWSNVSPPGLTKQDRLSDMAYTRSGKLILAGVSTDTYISADKGKTWTLAGAGLGTGAAYQFPVELNNGDLYLLSYTNILYKSSDGGKSWTPLANATNAHVTAICSDDNGWFYKAVMTSGVDDAILVSKDNGATFSNLYDFTVLTNQPYIVDMSVQRDGLFYFGGLVYAVYRIPYANQVTTYALTNMAFPAYIVSKANTFLYGKYDGFYYY